jgi:hypothetical protein
MGKIVLSYDQPSGTNWVRKSRAHSAEFLPVERKKLIRVFISACVIVICFSGLSSFNNSFINKGRIILTAKHLVHFLGRYGIYECEKGHQTYFSSCTSVCVVTHHFTNFSYLCITISSVTGFGSTFGPTVPGDISYSTTRFCRMEGNKKLYCSIEF